MASFLSVHGYTPGPTQRPYSAGAISGVIATAPAVAILYAFGSLRVEASILRLSILATLAAGWVAMGVAGAVYGRVFGRAANNVHGGWLFGMVFGFVLWAAGADMILPLLSRGATPAGPAAVGVALSMLAWGCALGALMPFVHRPLHENLEAGAKAMSLGPNAATQKGVNLPKGRS
jgi:hypothetical protein